ncbi:putative vacuolar protein sorting-associated protein TDA6 [Lachnellula suecica]|uniref:Putative vacuolar protein sorting-associated protein TDA6 n=1 Tax=Lachnellula suecica TaxID=602035 RepID=A0A8T9CE29_9HELO|nr:putative vacuolar protein sorting-associated protein TDA6 [Lachnellula suecica]
MEDYEKKEWVELEKGEYVRVDGNGNGDPASGHRSTHVRRRAILFIALLVLTWHDLLRGAPPATVTRHVDGIPQYVLDYVYARLKITREIAPLTYLDIAEAYFPSDIGAQISNTHPNIPINISSTLTVKNLDILNKYGHNGRAIFLTSNTDVSHLPSWLTGVVPSSSTGATENATSCVIILAPKPGGVLDAFYMYFYAYNQGNTVLGRELGDHIGDWEHNMIRFVDGEPSAVWFSQHGNGEAFTYAAVEKAPDGKRPINFSARGSHANYAVPGAHDHLIPDLNLPAGFLLDYTSKGMLWDPTLNAYFYNYIASNHTFEGINGAPEGALLYRGHWGDKQYPASDKRQKSFLGFSKFVSGPTGPRNKGLDRTLVCPDNGIPCIVRERLGP